MTRPGIEPRSPGPLANSLTTKDGNIVDLSHNSNKAGINIFAFILSRVFSQYKDIVHVILTKCLQAENLYNIMKWIIIGLEEIGFQVLSIIINNNSINKKAIYFFCSSPEF